MMRSGQVKIGQYAARGRDTAVGIGHSLPKRPHIPEEVASQTELAGRPPITELARAKVRGQSLTRSLAAFPHIPSHPWGQSSSALGMAEATGST